MPVLITEVITTAAGDYLASRTAAGWTVDDPQGQPVITDPLPSYQEAAAATRGHVNRAAGSTRAIAGLYIRYNTINRQTGTRVQIRDLEHRDREPWPTGKARWAIVCVDHHLAKTRATWVQAREDVVTPRDWCTKCARL